MSQGNRKGGGDRTEALLAAVLMLPALLWILVDRSVWAWDQAWFGRCVLGIRDAGNVWEALMQVLPTKQPGHVWLACLTVWLAPVLGGVDPAILLSVWFTQLAALLLVAGMVRALGAGAPAVTVSLLMTASAPLFVGMTLQFFAEALQLVAAAWFFWILAHAARWTWPRVALHLAAATAVGMLAKISTPLYTVLPGLAALWLAFGHRARSAREGASRAEWIAVGALAAGCGVLAVSWYGINWSQAVMHLRNSSSAEGAALWGRQAAFSSKWFMWCGQLRDNLLPGAGGVLVLAMLVAAAGRAARKETAGGTEAPLALAGLTGLLTVGLVLTVFSFQINEDPRYLLPAWPAAVAALAWWISRAGQPWIWKVLIAGFALQWLAVSGTILGVWKNPGFRTSHLPAADVEGRERAELLRVIRATCGPASRERPSVVGVSLPWLNVLTLNHYAAQEPGLDAGPLPFTNFGWREEDPDRAFRNVMSQRPLHYIIPAPSRFPAKSDPQNRIAYDVYVRVLQSGRFEEVPLEGVRNIVVFRVRE